MVELALIALGLALPLRLWRRRHERRQERLDAAYDRARSVRLAGGGLCGSFTGIYTERFFNPN